MPGETTFITIAIPTFNRAKWLGECISAALAQTHDRFEVVVSDNASTDDTAAILKTFADPRLRVIRQESNIGANGNWNECLRVARGQYIVLVSDDDNIEPWFLDKCARLIRQEPNIPVVIALGDVSAPMDSYRKPARVSRRLQTGIHCGLTILNEFLEDRISPQMCTVLIRTESLRSRGGFPLGWPYSDDLVSWAPLLLSGRAGLVNERCGTYRIHVGTQTSAMPIDTILTDIARLTDEILITSDRMQIDPMSRKQLTTRLRRYLARHIVGNVAVHRRRGATLAETFTVIWNWRRSLYRLEFSDALALRREISLLLLPRALADTLRRLKRQARHTMPGSHSTGSESAGN